ncbi:MAG: hypothetical protein ACYDFT_01980 [Thermoplasmata archaeon]
MPRSEEGAFSSQEMGRAWAPGQIAFHAFGSARSAFADCARDGENAEHLRIRVNQALLGDLEQKVLALRMPHDRLRARDVGSAFADKVAGRRERAGMA